MTFSTLFLVLSSFTLIFSEKIDYYWKDYTGEIPDDAFPGGQDRNHFPTYIGQVYISNQGLLPGPIIGGKKSVTTSKAGIYTSDVFVKILCTNTPEKLSWVPALNFKFSNDTNGRHVVVGGTENGEILNIGRVAYQGEVVVGKVCGYEKKDKALYIVYSGNEIAATFYELLVYNKNA